MEKVFITGATGFIGANLLRRLVQEDKFEIHISMEKGSDTWRIADVLEKVVKHEVDIMDYDSLKSLMDEIKPDYIFHLAMYGGYPNVESDESKTLSVSLLGTYNMLRATLDIDYKCFVNTGTRSEYGVKLDPMKETDILEPDSVYAVSKAASTLLCQSFAKKYDKPVTTLRIFSVYGYYEYSARFRLIPDVILHCLKDEDVEMSSGEQKRDFVFIEDVVEAYVLAMEKPVNGGSVFNVGTGNDSVVKDVAEKIVSKMGSDIKLNYNSEIKESSENSISLRADISKIKTELGWEPRFSLDEGLDKTISWFKENIKLY